jgi:aminoglycoside 2'-N-acetyltransferase I
VSGAPRVRIMPTGELTRPQLDALRRLLDAAFEEGFSDEDWDHAMGGLHAVVLEGDLVLSHAAVVPRVLVADGRPWRTGYVEAVATALDHRRRGHASGVMQEAGDIVRRGYELGALSTGVTGFYARLGWELWRGPTFTSAPAGLHPTPDEDGTVMILRTSASQALDVDGPLACDWRAGDVW